MQLPKTTKFPWSMHKWVLYSLLLSGIFLGLSSLHSHQQKQRRAAKSVAIDRLGVEIDDTEKQMAKITKNKQWTKANSKHFDSVLRDYKQRLARLRQP